MCWSRRACRRPSPRCLELLERLCMPNRSPSFNVQLSIDRLVESPVDRLRIQAAEQTDTHCNPICMEETREIGLGVREMGPAVRCPAWAVSTLEEIVPTVDCCLETGSLEPSRWWRRHPYSTRLVERVAQALTTQPRSRLLCAAIGTRINGLAKKCTPPIGRDEESNCCWPAALYSGEASRAK